MKLGINIATIDNTFMLQYTNSASRVNNK